MHHLTLNNLLAQATNFKKLAINLEDADHETLVFYHLNSTEQAAANFFTRLQTSQYGAVITNRSVPGMENFPRIVVVPAEDFMLAQQKMADILYPMSWDQRHLVGVTGTNGKTSIVHLAGQISRYYGKGVLQIGTVGVQLNGVNVDCPFAMTTPAYLDLRKIFFQYQGQFDVAYLEVSSHALEQQRLNDLRLSYGAWASFSQDHLDYHQNMESYLAAKKKIVHLGKDENFRLLLPAENDFLPLVADLNPLLVPDLPFTLPFALQVNFNRKNLALAWKLNELLWGPQVAVAHFPWAQLTLPPGRFETISWADKDIIIDYAHTPDALANIAQAICFSFPHRPLVIVFGCGGDRDRQKRPLMGKIATDWGQRVVITTDNPRSEEPAVIAAEIAAGILRSNYTIILDRETAICQQLRQLVPGEILLIAGKGHEAYQEIQGKKYPFSDRGVVMDFLQKQKEQ